VTEDPLGKKAENLAQAFLGEQGLDVVAKNVRTEGGELDLVVMDGGVLVFVEVKGRTRREFGLPEEYVDRRKRQRLASAAEAYLNRLPGSRPSCRFDVVAVDFSQGDPVLRHIKDAFRPGD
jgi:putative endonuclease